MMVSLSSLARTRDRVCEGERKMWGWPNAIFKWKCQYNTWRDLEPLYRKGNCHLLVLEQWVYDTIWHNYGKTMMHTCVSNRHGIWGLWDSLLSLWCVWKSKITWFMRLKRYPIKAITKREWKYESLVLISMRYIHIILHMHTLFICWSSWQVQ